MNMRFHLATQHAGGVVGDLDPIDADSLADRVQDGVLGWQGNGLGVVGGIGHILRGDQPVIGRHWVHSGIVEALNVAAGDSQEQIPDSHLGLLFGIAQG